VAFYISSSKFVHHEGPVHSFTISANRPWKRHNIITTTSCSWCNVLLNLFFPTWVERESNTAWVCIMRKVSMVVCKIVALMMLMLFLHQILRPSHSHHQHVDEHKRTVHSFPKPGHSEWFKSHTKTTQFNLRQAQRENAGSLLLLSLIPFCPY
jgi:hypothetical protein